MGIEEPLACSRTPALTTIEPSNPASPSGLERFLTATRRQDFPVPPRCRRAPPVTKVA